MDGKVREHATEGSHCSALGPKRRGSDRQFVEDIVKLLNSVDSSSSLSDLVHSVSQQLNLGSCSVDQLTSKLCETISVIAEEKGFVDATVPDDVAFLLPWCQPYSQKHKAFCMILSFAISLDEVLPCQTESRKFLVCLCRQLHDILSDQLLRKETLKSAAVAAAIGYLCRATQQNQVTPVIPMPLRCILFLQLFSAALMDVLLADDDAVAVVVLHSLLFSWTTFFEASWKKRQRGSVNRFPVETLFSGLVQVCTSRLNIGDNLAQFCSTRIAAHGCQYGWWSDLDSNRIPIHLRSGLN